jgi:hypothetical protein
MAVEHYIQRGGAANFEDSMNQNSDIYPPMPSEAYQQKRMPQYRSHEESTNSSKYHNSESYQPNSYHSNRFTRSYEEQEPMNSHQQHETSIYPNRSQQPKSYPYNNPIGYPSKPLNPSNANEEFMKYFNNNLYWKDNSFMYKGEKVTNNYVRTQLKKAPEMKEFHIKPVFTIYNPKQKLVNVDQESRNIMYSCVHCEKQLTHQFVTAHEKFSS